MALGSLIMMFHSGNSTGFNIGTGFNGVVQSIAIQSDGKILVGGTFTSYNGTTQNRITRLNSDGTRDTGFTIGTGFSNAVNSIAIQSDGKILVGGAFNSYNGTTQYRITRLNTNGNIDSTGLSTVAGSTGFDGTVTSIALQSDGKIVAGGVFQNYDNALLKYMAILNSNGTRYTSFLPGSGFNGDVNSIAIQSDNKIVAGGNFTDYNGTTQNRITRVNSNGTRDTGFTIGTGVGPIVTVWSIAIQSDGKILVGGSFSTINGTSQNRITRLNSNGTRDTSFTIGTGFSGGDVYSIAIQSDGKILVGGSFTSYNGTTQNRITRLNSDGTIDTSFTTGTGFNNYVRSIVIKSDGKIVVGGNFTSYNDISQNYITILNNNGTR